MARRIILSVLALVIVALSAVAVPLGVITVAQDRRDFTDQALASATTLGNVAEERLDDGVRGPALDRTVRQLSGSGDRIAILDPAGRPIAGTAARPAVSAAQLARAASRAQPAVYPAGGWITVVRPVLTDSGGGHVGTVVLARPTAPIDARAARLWAQIAAVCAAALLAAVLVAIGLARWVSGRCACSRRPRGVLATGTWARGRPRMRARWRYGAWLAASTRWQPGWRAWCTVIAP